MKQDNKPMVRRITVRLTEEQYQRAIERASQWKAQGTGSRSLNDWCLIQLIGGAKNGRITTGITRT